MTVSNNQVVTYKMSREFFNATKYRAFFEENKDKFANKKILQDNVRFHHAKIVKEYTTENNTSMNYIPAYSPIFNPIELVFSQLKFAFKKMDHVNMEADIKKSIETVTPDNLQNYFSHVKKIIIDYANK